MSERKILAYLSADWHLDSKIWKDRPQIKGDSFFALNQVFELSLRQGIPLLAAGDLFTEPQPTMDVLWECRQACAPFTQRQLYYVKGNHDDSVPSPLQVADPGILTWSLDRDAFRISHDVAVIGMDYHHPREWDKVLTNLQELRHQVLKETDNKVQKFILLCHQAWTEFMGKYATLQLRQLSGFDLVVSGDLHQHVALPFIDAEGKERICLSPGHLAMQNIRQDPEPKVFRLFDDLTYESVPLFHRPLYAFQPTSDGAVVAALSDICNLKPQPALPEEIRKPIILITSYQKDFPYKRFVEACKDVGHLFWQDRSVQPVLLVDEAQTSASIAEDRPLEEALPQVCSNPVHLSFLQRLLDSSAANVELKVIKQERLAALGSQT